MLSGIGPTAHLQSLEIPVVHDLPGVGKNLVDHPIVDIHFLRGLVESYRYIGNPKSAIYVLKIIRSLFQYRVFNYAIT